MIIFRQKQYTRADKKVYQELYRATGGFKHAPITYKNLTARDALRLTNITNQINKLWETGKGNINKEELFELANHLGLKETANNGEHLIKKITNRKLADRYQKIYKKSHKRSIDTELNKLDARFLSHRKTIEKINKHSTIPETLNSSDKDLAKKLESTILQEGIVLEKNPKIPDSCSRMFYPTKHELGVIETGKSPRALILAHENGHFHYTKRTNPNSGNKSLEKLNKERCGNWENRWGKTEVRSGISSLGEEVGADTEALISMKKHGATKEQLEHAKEKYKETYDGYVNNAGQKVSLGMIRRFKGIDV